MSGSRVTASRRQPPTDNRFTARSRSRRLRRVAYGVLAGLAVAAAAAAIWLLGWSSLTTLQTLRVEGADGPLEAEVWAAAEAPMGEQLIRIDTDAVATRVGEMAELAAVSVQRSWPRTLVVSVTQRVPAATIRADGSWWLVDGSGVLFRPADERPVDLPVFDAPAGDAADTTRAAGVAVLTSLPAAVRDLVETVSAHNAADIRMTLTTGATVRWGGPGDSADKAAVLLTLLAEDARSYDVSAPGRPAITP
jgi:cell division protein FtsQ